MFHAEAKVYFDGSHYIAIPHTEGKKRKPKEPEEMVEVIEKDKSPPDSVSSQNVEKQEIMSENCEKPKKMSTRSEIFNDAYAEAQEMPKQHRKEYLIDTMRPYFKDEQDLDEFVREKIISKRRNTLQRKTRFIRKAYLNEFNYFATFTYDSKKVSAKAFKKQLSKCLSNFQQRHNWRYMGVWERAPKTKRLHFHCLLYAPKGTMPGEMIIVRDYDTKNHRMQETLQNTYFNERFGRSDFEEIDDTLMKMGRAMVYILKYIEKTEERIVYSRGIPMYLISDIDENDILCYYGVEDRKMILADDFTCYDLGEEIGPISQKTMKQLRKTNN